MEILSYIVGGAGAAYFLSLFMFALIGVAINLTMNVNGRDVKSAATPVQFSWRFFILDNRKRIFNSFLLIYVTLRFAPYILPSNLYEAIPQDMEFMLATLIGFSFDKLSEILKDKAKLLSVNRENIQ